MLKKLLLFISFTLLIFGLVACDFISIKTTNNSTNTDTSVTTIDTATSTTDDITVTIPMEKTIPVYQGMVVSTNPSYQQLSYRFSETGEGINQDDPYNNFDGETIEDEIIQRISLPEAQIIDYNVGLDQVFYVTVKIHNPSQFEILSFTLNGIKYQSYQFQEGSDSENLILKMNPITTPGLIEYTIDQIKYVDLIEIKDAIIEGNQTVRVASEYEEVPVSLITNKVISPHSLSYDLNIGDPKQLIVQSNGSLKLFVYDGRDIIFEQDLNIGLNNIAIDMLHHNTLYQYAVVAVYDSYDGNGPKLIYLEKEAFYTLNYISLTNFNVTQDSISFSLTNNAPSAFSLIKEISLYQGETLIEELLSYDNLEFTGLLSNVNYSVKLTFSYDLMDGLGEKEETNAYNITTLAKAVPEVFLQDILATQTEVSFEIETIDIDNILTINTIELYYQETLTQTITDLTNLSFNNLLSDNPYQMQVNYQYDLSDGYGVIYETVSYAFATSNKTAPSSSIKITDSTNESISYLFEATDIDNVGSLKAVEIYDPSNILIASILGNEEATFTGLVPDTNYTLKAIYEYDLNDGIGVRELTTTSSIYTAAHITVLSTNVINTNKLTEGDTLVLEISVVNTSGTDFTRVKINGSYFKVSEVTTSDFIRIEMVIDGSYAGGTTEFLVETIEGYSRGVLREFLVSENNYGSAFINGDIFVDNLRIVDGNNNELDFVMPGDVFYVEVNFKNPSAYNLESVNIEGIGRLDKNNFTVSNNNSTIKIQQTSRYYNNVQWYSLRDFTYSSDSVGVKTKYVDGVYNSIVSVRSTEYRNISTIDELRNMQSGYAYRLINDLDFTGVDWNPISLNYIVFDGNGFTIYNLKNVKTYVDTSIQYGLFKSINYSNVKNLNLYNSLIMITVNNSTTSAEYPVYAGLLAGTAYLSNFNNISVQGEISVDNTTSNSDNVGGLIGNVNRSAFNQIYINAIVSGDNFVGGLAGSAGDNTIVERTYITGKIYGLYYLGGIMGYGYNSSLLNVYSTSQIYSNNNWGVGGLVGYGGQIMIKDSYSANQFIGDYSYYNSGLGGSIYNSTVINSFSFAIDQNGNPVYALRDFSETWENVYSLVDEEYAINATKEEIIQIMSSLWDLEVWSFSIDSIKLKWVPTVRIADIIVTETTISFNVASTDFDQVGEVYSIELYKDGVLLETLTNFTNPVFNLLRYNTEYTVKVKYVYNYGDSVGNQFVEVSRNITTAIKEGTPTLEIINLVTGQEEVTFEMNFNDPTNIVTIDKIELYDVDGILVYSLTDFTTLKFGNLLTNNIYIIKVTYGYDFNDGLGYQQFISQKNFTTLSKQVPVITFADVRAGEFGISFVMDVLDPDNISALISAEIYQGESLVESLADFTNLGFGNLASNTVYTIKLQYQYDLNDGSGVHFIDLETTSKTAPHVALVSVQILNTESLIVGDTLVIKVNIENPDNVIFTKMLVNGIYYDLDISMGSALQASLTVDEAFGAGETLVVLEAIKGNLGVDEYTYEFDSNNELTTFINGTIYVQGVSLINEFGDEIEYVLRGQTYYVKVDFYNPTGYDIHTIKINSNNYSLTSTGVIVNQAKNSVLIPRVAYYNNVIVDNVYEFTYSNSTISTKTRQVAGFYGTTVILNDDIIREINNVQDLASIQAGYYYKLTNDIDLAGITWNPISFYGVFDGNGYNITNLTIVRTYEDTSPYVGLFSSISGGIIKNVTLLGSSINVTVNSSSTNTYGSHVGALAGYANNYTRIENVFSTSNIIVKNNTNYYNTYTGGLVGKVYNVSMNKVYTTGSISTTSGRVGGISAYGDYINVKNALSTTNILTHNYDTAGLFATLFYSTIENSYSNQNLASTSSNGLVYYMVGTEIRNSFTLSKYNDYNVKAVGGYYDGSVLYNTYSLNTNYASEYLPKTEILNYMKTVWDLTAWSFSENQALLKRTPSVRVVDVSVTETTISFAIASTDFDQVGEVYSVELYKDGVLLETLTDLSNLTFDVLRYNTEYTLKVTYVYNYNDSVGDQFVEGSKNIYTAIKEGTPTVEIINVLPGQEEVIFALNINDIENIGQIDAIKLFDNEGLEIANLTDYTNLYFGDLLTNKSYIIKVTYGYDFNDGLGYQQFVFQKEFTTLNKQVPQISFKDVLAGEFGINFVMEVIDPDNISALITAEIYQGESLVESLADFTNLGFGNLASNTVYTIKLQYQYDLNDGTGVHYLNFETTAKTAPHVSLISMEIVNTEALIVGDTLVINAVFENPDNITFTKMKINGIYYNINVVTATNLQLSFTVDEAFGGGDTLVVLEAIKGILGNDEYTYEFTTSNSESIFINGEIKVENIKIVDALGQELEYVIKGQQFFIQVEFYNPTAYNIESIGLSIGTFSSSSFTINADKTIITIPFSTYDNRYIRISINNYTYSNATISSKTRQVSGIYDAVAVLNNDNVRNIYTVSDLQNMQSGYYYRLMNDIDLKGITWNPYNFYGILDGNNHVIYNLTIVKTYEDSSIYAGLFSNIEGGLVKDLFILNFNINITLNSSSSAYYYDLYAGSLAGQVNNYTKITNVIVSGQMQAINNTRTGNYSFIGGLVGQSYNAEYRQIQTSGTLSSNSGYSGGIFGRLDYSSMINSFSNMTILSSGGGSAGLIGRASNSTIENSYSNQKVVGPQMLGLIYSKSNCQIINSYTLSYFETSPGNVTFVSDAYYVNDLETILDIQSNWSTDVWSFAGDNPVLKFIPNVTVTITNIGETDVIFTISTTDFDNVGSIASIGIYKDGTLVEELLDNSLRTFTNIRYNSEYTIKVIYEYDYLDGLGIQTVETFTTFTTLPKTGSPTVEITNVVPFDSYINFDIVSTDPLMAGQLAGINIYDNQGVLVESLVDLTLRSFVNLNPYTYYTIEVLYEYDFNDGYGLQYIKDTYTVKTNPYFTLNSITVLNTEALILGDTLVLQFNVDNPNNIVFTSVNINGLIYPVASSSTTKLRVDINVTEDLGMAETVLNINNLSGSLNNEAFTFNLDANNTVSVFINGNISVVSITPVDINGDQIEYITINSPYYAKVLFDNPTGYQINQITLGDVTYDSTQFTLNEDNTIALINLQSLSYYFSWACQQTLYIQSFVYSNDRVLPKTRIVGGIYYSIILVQDANIRYISTVEDLVAMENGYVYYLINDIDMTGIPFEPLKQFSGVFNGQGYTIYNLSLIKTYEDVSPDIGFFSSITSGIVTDLNISGINYIITVKSAVSNELSIYAGGLSGRVSERSIIRNISVSGEIVINNQTSGRVCSGGIIGFATNSQLTNLDATINLTFNGVRNDSPTGGVVGYLQFSTLDVAYASGSISGNYDVGGIVGNAYASTISNCFTNDMTITGKEYSGGIVGGMSRTILSDSYSLAVFTNISYYIGGIVGYTTNFSSISNSYSYTIYMENIYESLGYFDSSGLLENTYSPIADGYSTVANLEDMQVAMAIVWDSLIWNFINTDEDGNPVLY